MKIYHQNMVYHQNFFVYGHRGVPSLLDENTLESFEKAIELNYDGVELDVVITKDERLVINHDISLKKNNQSSLISDWKKSSLQIEIGNSQIGKNLV